MTASIRTAKVRSCLLCGAAGGLLYDKVRDRVFSVPGDWSIWHCPSPACGLLWLNPMPTVEDVHRVYDTYYTYAEEHKRNGALRRLFAASKRGYIATRFGYRDGASIVERVLGVLPWLYPGRPAELNFSVMWLAAPSGKVLDVGAGSGWLLENLRDFGWQAEGLDFDPRVVAHARDKGLNVHHGGLLERRFADSSFDAVTMSHNLEHVHDPVAWLAAARHLLRPGGRLAIATPNSASYLHRRFGEHWFPLEPPRHLYLFNRATLSQALRKAGFSCFRVFTSARDAAGVFLASRAIRETGRHDMARASGPGERLLGRAMQFAELNRLIVDRDAGEDLIAVAEK